MTNLLRFRALDERDINKETFVEPWPEVEDDDAEAEEPSDTPTEPQPAITEQPPEAA